MATLLAVALAASALGAALAVAATIPAFSSADVDDRASGSGGERAKPPGGSIPTPPPAEIRELVGLLVDEDLEVRKATVDRLVAIGEPALPILEEEMRRRKLGAMGQVKIALLKLRSLREDRLWNEALSRLSTKPSETTLRAESVERRPSERRTKERPAPGNEAGGGGGSGGGSGSGGPEGGAPRGEGGGSIKPGGKVTLRTSPGASGAIALEVLFPGSDGTAHRVLATLAGDRTLSPVSVELRSGDHETARFQIAANRLTGQGPGGALDAPAPPPLCLDWALPLVVAAMPRVAETELVFTLLEAERGSIAGLRTLHCLGEQPQRDGQGKPITAYELRGENVATRRFEVDSNGRVASVELGGGVTLSR